MLLRNIMFQAVCDRLSIDVSDRLAQDSKKYKFLVAMLPDEKVSNFED